MPTYEYQCDACEHNFDEFQSMSDKTLKKCPKCGKLKLRRIFGAGAAIIFKGSGFYQTDYRSDSYKQAAKAEQEAPKKTGDGAASSDGTTPKSDSTSANGTAQKSKTGPTGKSAKTST